MFETETAPLVPCLERLIERQIHQLHQLGGGRNSRVYRVDCRDGFSCIAKHYFGGERDRLGVEFGSLQFLWNNGIRAIPEPLRKDAGAEVAAYEYISGKPVFSTDICDSDILAAIKFLKRLAELRRAAVTENLPDAAEAYFSFDGLTANIEVRLQRFAMAEAPAPHLQALRHFLGKRFLPEWRRLQKKAAAQLSGLLGHEVLPAASRILSPSDFGFHNAIRRANGNLTFVDFEYFGWDDPAKTASDFLLHPGMQLSVAQKRFFLSHFLQAFSGIDRLAERIRVLLPVFGLKWCLILLNEFLPIAMSRRLFAGRSGEAHHQLLSQQLDKAVRMFELSQTSAQTFLFQTR